jgi:hypothetical protein
MEIANLSAKVFENLIVTRKKTLKFRFYLPSNPEQVGKVEPLIRFALGMIDLVSELRLPEKVCFCQVFVRFYSIFSFRLEWVLFQSKANSSLHFVFAYMIVGNIVQKIFCTQEMRSVMKLREAALLEQQKLERQQREEDVSHVFSVLW